MNYVFSTSSSPGSMTLTSKGTCFLHRLHYEKLILRPAVGFTQPDCYHHEPLQLQLQLERLVMMIVRLCDDSTTVSTSPHSRPSALKWAIRLFIQQGDAGQVKGSAAMPKRTATLGCIFRVALGIQAPVMMPRCRLLFLAFCGAASRVRAQQNWIHVNL